MSARCPWCNVSLDKRFLHQLTSVGVPCPHCEKPVRQSAGQVFGTVVMLSPLIVLTLYVAKALHDAGATFAAIFVLFAGMVAGSYLQRFLPVWASPAKALYRGGR